MDELGLSEHIPQQRSKVPWMTKRVRKILWEQDVRESSEDIFAFCRHLSQLESGGAAARTRHHRFPYAFRPDGWPYMEYKEFPGPSAPLAFYEQSRSLRESTRPPGLEDDNQHTFVEDHEDAVYDLESSGSDSDGMEEHTSSGSGGLGDEAWQRSEASQDMDVSEDLARVGDMRELRIQQTLSRKSRNAAQSSAHTLRRRSNKLSLRPAGSNIQRHQQQDQHRNLITAEGIILKPIGYIPGASRHHFHAYKASPSDWLPLHSVQRGTPVPSSVAGVRGWTYQARQPGR